MTLRDPRAWLVDLLAAADLAMAAVARHEDGSSYAKSLEDRAIVERQIEIIAECLKRLLASEPGLSLRFYEARDVIALRNIVSHAYHQLDHVQIWQTIRRDLPSLRERAAQLLAERGGTP